MALSICAGTLGGRWVQDNWTHWAPGTMLIGFGLGCIAAARALMRTSQEWRREIELEEASRLEQLDPSKAGESELAVAPEASSAVGDALSSPLGGVRLLISTANSKENAHPESEATPDSNRASQKPAEAHKPPAGEPD